MRLVPRGGRVPAGSLPCCSHLLRIQCITGSTSKYVRRIQVVLVLCRCVCFLFERGLYVTVVLRLAHFAGRGRVIVIGVPAAWTWPRPIWDASRILVLALV